MAPLSSVKIPKGAALIRGRRLFETWRLLEEIQYMVIGKNCVLWWARSMMILRNRVRISFTT